MRKKKSLGYNQLVKSLTDEIKGFGGYTPLLGPGDESSTTRSSSLPDKPGRAHSEHTIGRCIGGRVREI